MKNKKVSILLALALAFTTLLTGCGSDKGTAAKPVGEVLRAAVEKQFEIESSHGKVDMVLNVEMPDEATADPNVALVAPFLKEAKLSMDQYAMMKEGKAYSTIEAEAGGQKVAGEMYMLSPTQMVFKTDMMDQMVVFDMEKIAEMAAMSGSPMSPTMPTDFTSYYSDEYKPYVKLGLDFLGEAFKGMEPSERKTEEYEFSTGKESLDMITYSYVSNDELIKFIETSVNNIMASEKLYEIIYNDETKKLMGEGVELPTKEQFDQAMKMGKDAFDTQFPTIKEELNKNVEIKEISLKMGIDKDGYMRYTKVVVDLVAKNGEMELPVKLTMESSIDQVNAVKAEDIKTVEVDETNSINFEEFIGAMMMGGMEMQNEATEDMDMDDMDMDDMDMDELEMSEDELNKAIEEMDELELTDEEREALEQLEKDLEQMGDDVETTDENSGE